MRLLLPDFVVPVAYVVSVARAVHFKNLQKLLEEIEVMFYRVVPYNSIKLETAPTCISHCEVQLMEDREQVRIVFLLLHLIYASTS